MLLLSTPHHSPTSFVVSSPSNPFTIMPTYGNKLLRAYPFSDMQIARITTSRSGKGSSATDGGGVGHRSLPVGGESSGRAARVLPYSPAPSPSAAFRREGNWLLSAVFCLPGDVISSPAEYVLCACWKALKQAMGVLCLEEQVERRIGTAFSHGPACSC